MNLDPIYMPAYNASVAAPWLPEILFYIFSILIAGSGLMVISGRNPVHSVLFLIFAFVNAAGIFLLAGAEFLAMIIIIVYVGAVAVLFLFVVMMLDVDFARLKAEAKESGKGRLIAMLVGFIFLAELFLLISSRDAGQVLTAVADPVDNTKALGAILYTNYFLAFQAAGVVLLIAMIGAIVLTLRYRAGVKKQNIKQQIWREREDSVTLKDVPVGRGTGELTNLEFRN